MASEVSAAARLQTLRRLPLSTLKKRFWSLARDIMTPLAQLASSHTSPSIERSVMMRMGFDSLESQRFVEHLTERGWLCDGAGRVLHDCAATRGVNPRQAYAMMLGLPDEPDSAKAAVAGSAPDIRIDPQTPLPVDAILEGLEHYRTGRRRWTWRLSASLTTPFTYRQVSQELAAGGRLQSAAYLGGLDPQPDCTISAEIASGRFEDDLRRMRMAAWHGADHIMVIRTLGQSHYDGLIEGTPEGVGGVPISRKQLRATRRALDIIEAEVGRPINLHSYVSGLAGSEMAVLFAEEGVAGAHQDFQYNILYRGINPERSVVDSFEAKRILGDAGILQVDGAHNANSTALKAWNVRPEVLVQHALNCSASELAGMPRNLVALSTVPPTAPPAPKLTLDLPFAMAVRHLFTGFVLRAQQNTRYSTTNTSESIVLHVLDTLITRLCGADIQSTIAPDEARCVPWHSSSVQAVTATKQALIALDGLANMTTVDLEALRPAMVELIARSVLMMEDILAIGGYFAALEDGYFVDSGEYPDREQDGIRRERTGGVGAGSVVARSARYLAPVCSHFGVTATGSLVMGQSDDESKCSGCSLCDPTLVRYIDELDSEDSAPHRRHALLKEAELVRPEAEHTGDGQVTVSMFIPLPETSADEAALEVARTMNLESPRIVDRLVLHPAEGVQYEIVGRVAGAVRRSDLGRPASEATSAKLSPEEIRTQLSSRRLRVVGATLGDDAHTVGLQEVTNLKHQGLEWFGVECVNIGSSVMVERLLDEGIEQGACAVLASLIVSHRGIHELTMRKLNDVAIERGIRGQMLLIAGGPQVSHGLAISCGLDAGFGPATRGVDLARFLAEATTARADWREPDTR